MFAVPGKPFFCFRKYRSSHEHVVYGRHGNLFECARSLERRDLASVAHAYRKVRRAALLVVVVSTNGVLAKLAIHCIEDCPPRFRVDSDVIGIPLVNSLESRGYAWASRIQWPAISRYATTPYGRPGSVRFTCILGALRPVATEFIALLMPMQLWLGGAEKTGKPGRGCMYAGRFRSGDGEPSPDVRCTRERGAAHAGRAPSRLRRTGGRAATASGSRLSRPGCGRRAG